MTLHDAWSISELVERADVAAQLERVWELKASRNEYRLQDTCRLRVVDSMTASPSSRIYPTDLTDAQWALVAPILTERHGPGRPPQLDRRRVLNGLLYLEHAGCQWRLLPKEFGHGETVRYYFDQWTQDGTLERLHTRLRERVR